MTSIAGFKADSRYHARDVKWVSFLFRAIYDRLVKDGDVSPIDFLYELPWTYVKVTRMVDIKNMSNEIFFWFEGDLR